MVLDAALEDRKKLKDLERERARVIRTIENLAAMLAPSPSPISTAVCELKIVLHWLNVAIEFAERKLP